MLLSGNVNEMPSVNANPLGVIWVAPVLVSSMNSKSSDAYGEPAGGGAGLYMISEIRSAGGVLPMMKTASTSALHSPVLLRYLARIRRLVGIDSAVLDVVERAELRNVPPGCRGSRPSNE